MTALIKALLLASTMLASTLRTCSITFPSGSSKSSSSYSYSSRTYVQDRSRFRIVREKNPSIIDYEYIYANGGMSSFTIEAFNEDGSVWDVKPANCFWKVGNTDYMTVDSGGTVTGKKNGTTTLRATFNDFYDEIEVKIATIARTFELSDAVNNYRKGQNYDFPLTLSPSTASVFYEIETPGIIQQIEGSNRFRAAEVGETKVTATAITHWNGERTTKEFTISVIDENAPQFYFKDKLATEGSVSVPKNKYKALAYSEWGITAKDRNGVNINGSISVVSGNYSLSEAGDYEVVLSAEDGMGSASRFALHLSVTEYEIVKEQAPYDAITYEYKWELIKENAYSQAIGEVAFTLTATLNEKYHHAEGKLIWLIYLYATNWGKYYVYDHVSDPIRIEENVSEKSARTIKIQYSFKKEMHPDTLRVDPPIAVLNGTCFIYKTY